MRLHMRKLILGMSLAAATAVAIGPPALSASARHAGQDATPPMFDVATVKANTGADTNMMIRRLPGGRMTATNMPLRLMITYAYQLAGYQLVGGPTWQTTDRFDIVAKMNGNPEPVA